MFDTINRDAVIIAPNKGVIDWVNKIFPDEKVEYSNPLDYNNANIYLVPEREDEKARMKYLKSNFEAIFEDELMAWSSDEESWPQELTWELFEEWFHISLQSMVVDTLEDKITKEDI